MACNMYALRTYFYCISLLFQQRLRTNSYKGESETLEGEHSHGSKASCDEKTYAVTRIQVKIVMKRSNQT